MKKLAILLMAFLLFFGCTGSWRTIAEPSNNSFGPSPTSSGLPNSIGYLDVLHQYNYSDSENDWYEVSFTLEDEGKKVVTASGTLQVTVKDEKGNVLYNKQDLVLASDFESSAGYPFYGNPVYTTQVPFKGMAKSQTSYANFTVKFTTTDGRAIIKGKRLYLDSDLVNSSTKSTSSSSSINYKTFNMSASQGGVQVTFTKGALAGSSTYKTYYAYFDFKNLGTKKKTVRISDAAVVVNGNQYPASISVYGSSLGKIYAGATVSKYIYFYDVQRGSGNMTLYLELEVMEEGMQNQTLSYEFNFAP